jgi:hypothetical protein
LPAIVTGAPGVEPSSVLVLLMPSTLKMPPFAVFSVHRLFGRLEATPANPRLEPE